MNEETRERMKSLVGQESPDSMNRWLNDVWNGKESFDEDVNSWLFIYELIYAKAVTQNKSVNLAVNLNWVEPALKVLEYLSSRSGDHWSSFTSQIMNLRAMSICDHGEIEGSYVCDLESVFESFQKGISITPEFAVKKTQEIKDSLTLCKKGTKEYRELIKDISYLRSIKNNLNALEILKSAGYRRNSVEQWILIKDRLL